MSNTERKRLEREQRKAEEAAAPSPEEAKQQMEQAQQNIAEVAQAVPHSINDLFDQNNPLNILNARNITDDILGSRTNNRNLTQDEMIRQRILFMEPTKEWYDLLDKVEQSGTPFAKEIISRIKRKNAALIKKIENFSKEEGQAQVEYDQSIKEMQDVLNTLVNNTLARPSGLPGMSNVLGTLIPALDNYFDGGNSSGESLIDNPSVYQVALLSLYGTTDRILAQRHRDFDMEDVYKGMTDLISRFRGIYSRYGLSSATPNRNALEKEVQKIYVESFFGGLNPTGLKPTIERVKEIQKDAILSNLVPADILKIIDDKRVASNQTLKTLKDKRAKSLTEKEKLAKEISNTTKEVLSENGLEFNHGVSLSSSDISWDGVNDFQIGSDASGKPTLLPQQIPDDMKDLITPELKNSRGALNILNEALQAYPKPVALALKQFLIDNKSSIKFFTTSRGATAVVNLDNNGASAHDLDASANKLLGLGVGGPDRESAVTTTVHELVHLIVNGMFRNEMNPLEWAKRSRETNNVAPDGRISHDFVEGNYGNIPYTMNGDYLDADDIRTMIGNNELGAASKNFPQPYLGKYGYAPGTGLLLGQNPLSHGELLSTLFESLLSGGVTSMMSVGSINPKRVLSGTNPDGSPRYISINSDVFAESLIPYGVSMIVLLNELAKTRLGIA
jgi:hypothetical protein